MIDFSLDAEPIKNTDTSLLLQQIDILFDTHPGMVLGSDDYGTEYDKYLYDLKLSNEAIKIQVLNDLYSLDLQGFSPEVEVYMLQGTEQDICLINIILTKEDTSIKKTYKIR